MSTFRISVVDGLAEDDWTGWAALIARLGEWVARYNQIKYNQIRCNQLQVAAAEAGLTHGLAAAE